MSEHGSLQRRRASPLEKDMQWKIILTQIASVAE
jgi:hypothetical protein